MLEKMKKWFDVPARIIFITVVIAASINFLYFCTHNALSPDALGIGTQHIAGGWEISLGRWGIPIMDLFRNGIVNEVLICVISTAFLAFAAVLLIKIFKFKKPLILVTLGLMVAVFPTFSESALYIYCFDSYCLAFLLSVASVYLMKEGINWFLRFALPISLIIVSLSLYQAYFGVVTGLIAVICIGELISKKSSTKIILKTLARYLVTIAVALVLYYVLTRIITKITHHPLSSYRNADSGIGATISALFVGIGNAYNDVVKFLFVSPSHIIRCIINAIIVVLIVVCITTSIVRNRQWEKAVLMIAILVAFPIAVGVIDVITVGSTMNLLMDAPMLAIYMLALLLVSESGKVMLSFAMIFINLLSYSFLLSNQASFMARQDTYQNYYFVASDILSRAQKLPEYAKNQKICLNYVIEYKSPIASKSNNFIAELNENTEDFRGMLNTAKFYKRYLGQDVNFCSRQEYDEIVRSDEFDVMPQYPEDGSIKAFENVIFIKLNNKFFN